MDDIIRVNGQWYIRAASSYADSGPRVLKQGDTFALFDRHGDIRTIGNGEQGLYHAGTRFLSRLELTINGQRPLLLNSAISADNSQLIADLTTPDLAQSGQPTIPSGTVHIFRAKLLWEGACYEHLRVVNYGEQAVRLNLALAFDADFADLFEVRGVARATRGTCLGWRHTRRQRMLRYKGLDGVTRQTRIAFSTAADTNDPAGGRFEIELSPREKHNFYVTVSCEFDHARSAPLSYKRARMLTSRAMNAAQTKAGTVYTSNEQFNDWLNRSAADLRMLVTHTPQGAYPYAGVPWFSTPFGRDGLLTALQCLWLDPDIARGVLNFLAAHQAQEENPDQDAEPGKILHETRTGEMVALKEVPFQRYYGSADATPLFIVLADEYYARSADRDFLEKLWPHIEHALHWIDTYGDIDGDGFVEYSPHSATGLRNQGWKDSDDAVFHDDGRLAEGPIALCELQGYVYQAKRAAARIAGMLGAQEVASTLKEQALRLKKQFNETFWCEDLGTYILALDGEKRPCRVRSSNAGHALFSGIADKRHAATLSETLLDKVFYSGWGVRTIARSEARFNPMSYHNGSVWPHDNALIAMGLARYGHKDKALKIMTGMFDASIVMDLHRLPELFCGFERLPGRGPTLYPVACSPQAWASGSVFYLLQACLGLRFSLQTPHVCFNHPQLPEYLHELQINNLRIGDAVVDLALRRHPRDVGINVMRKEGDVDIKVVM